MKFKFIILIILGRSFNLMNQSYSLPFFEFNEPDEATFKRDLKYSSFEEDLVCPPSATNLLRSSSEMFWRISRLAFYS